VRGERKKTLHPEQSEGPAKRIRKLAATVGCSSGKVLCCVQDEEVLPAHAFAFPAHAFLQLPSFRHHILGRNPAAEHPIIRIHPQVVFDVADIEPHGVGCKR
jgi:hypothetical protein